MAGELQTNISLADLWLAGMASGAGASGRSVQYCMPYPYDVLAAASHAEVTNARATGDYFHATDQVWSQTRQPSPPFPTGRGGSPPRPDSRSLPLLQWAIGGTSLFYWAVGVLPFKDGFYSSNYKQVVVSSTEHCVSSR